jgi:hypothetical protein
MVGDRALPFKRDATCDLDHSAKTISLRDARHQFLVDLNPQSPCVRTWPGYYVREMHRARRKGSQMDGDRL